MICNKCPDENGARTATLACTCPMFTYRDKGLQGQYVEYAGFQSYRLSREHGRQGEHLRDIGQTFVMPVREPLAFVQHRALNRFVRKNSTSLENYGLTRVVVLSSLFPWIPRVFELSLTQYGTKSVNTAHGINPYRVVQFIPYPRDVQELG